MRPGGGRQLSGIEAYFTVHAQKLIVLDEIHRAPEIFAILRSQIDQWRRGGREGAHFLVLGSAPLNLMRQASEESGGPHCSPGNAAHPATRTHDPGWRR